MNCPHCNKPLPPNIVDTRATGSKGGKSAGGAAKRRDRAHYVDAGKASAAARAAKKSLTVDAKA